MRSFRKMEDACRSPTTGSELTLSLLEGLLASARNPELLLFPSLSFPLALPSSLVAAEGSTKHASPMGLEVERQLESSPGQPAQPAPQKHEHPKIAPETTRILMSALRQLDAAIELLPGSDRSEYDEAMKRCPELVASESNPVHWLLYEKLNVWNAAQRLTKYWQYRYEIFGKDRAFRPVLDLTPATDGSNHTNGAFTAQDLALLETGVIVPLPSRREEKYSHSNPSNHHPESHEAPKRHVFFSDRARMKAFAPTSMEAAARIPFFFYTRLVSLEDFDSNAQTVVTVDHFEFLPTYNISRYVMRVVREAFPFTLEPMVLAIPYTKKRTYFQELMPAMVARVGELFKSSNFIDIIVSESKLDLQHKLIEHKNLKRECLPTVVGGTWNYASFYTWLESEKNKIMRAGANTTASTSKSSATSTPELPGRKLSGSHVQPKDKTDANSHTSHTICLHSQRQQKLIPTTASIPTTSASNRTTQRNTTNPILTTSKTTTTDATSATHSATSNSSSSINSPSSTPTVFTACDWMQNMPWNRKAVFLEAIERCPDLVAVESPPILFLKYHGNNTNLASQHLAAYWQKRKDLFGPHNAFSPLKLDSLSSHSLETTRKLANHCQCSAIVASDDSNGRPILLYEPILEPSSSMHLSIRTTTDTEPIVMSDAHTHISYNTDLEKQDRSVFYHLTLLMMKESIQNGASLILLLAHYYDDFKWKATTSLHDLRCYFPFEFTSVHVVFAQKFISPMSFQNITEPTTRTNAGLSNLSLSSTTPSTWKVTPTSVSKIIGKLGHHTDLHLHDTGSSTESIIQYLTSPLSLSQESCSTCTPSIPLLVGWNPCSEYNRFADSTINAKQNLYLNPNWLHSDTNVKVTNVDSNLLSSAFSMGLFPTDLAQPAIAATSKTAKRNRNVFLQTQHLQPQKSKVAHKHVESNKKSRSLNAIGTITDVANDDRQSSFNPSGYRQTVTTENDFSSCKSYNPSLLSFSQHNFKVNNGHGFTVSNQNRSPSSINDIGSMSQEQLQRILKRTNTDEDQKHYVEQQKQMCWDAYIRYMSEIMSTTPNNCI